MRKNAKSWFIKFLITIISLAFVFSFGYSLMSRDRVKLGKVNGETIAAKEYDMAYRNLILDYQNQLKGVWNDKLIKAMDLQNVAFESLIQNKIILQEAKKLGLKVTEKELQEEILLYPAFQQDGIFSESRYRAILAMDRTTPEEFEESRRQAILSEKLRQFLTSFYIPSEQEILDNYTYSNEKVGLSFIKFSPENYLGDVKQDPGLIKEFFEQRKENYRIPDKIKISYIRISPEDYLDKVELDEKELVEYYENNLDMFLKEKQIKARHILFKLSPDDTPEKENKVKEKALSVLEKVKSGEDFAKLAGEYSEGPTKAKGGDLGYFTKGTLNKAFDEAAFSLKKGETGNDLVKSDLGYHIIKVEDIKAREPKKYDDVRDQIVTIFMQNMSTDMASDMAQTLIDQMPYNIDLSEYASQHDVKTESSPFFSMLDPIPIVTANNKLAETLFALDKGDVSELLELNNEFYIIQLSDKKPSYIPELDEVLSNVETDYIDHSALMAAKEDAEKYLSELKEGKDWDALAKEKGKTIESSGLFTRTGFPGKIGTTPGLQEAAFRLSEENPYADKVFDNQDGAFVIKFMEKQYIDTEKFEKDKDKYAYSLKLRKQRAIFSSWIQKMRAEAEIDRSNFDSLRSR